MEHRDLTAPDAIHPFAFAQDSDPGAVGAFKGWLDLTAPAVPVLRVRNALNAGWLPVAAAPSAPTDFADLTGVPGTLAGFGLLAETTALVESVGDVRFAASAHTHTYASLTAKPTDLAGFGIEDDTEALIYLIGGLAFADIDHDHDAEYAPLGHTHAFADLTATPTTIAGYGLTADFQTQGDARWSGTAHTHTFASLTAKPTTFTGYGIAGAQTLPANLTITTGGLTVSAGTTAVQALTATTVTATGTIQAAYGGFAVTPSAGQGIYVRSVLGLNSSQYGALIDAIATNTATAGVLGLTARARTDASGVATALIAGVEILSPSLGAGTTANNVYGLRIATQSGGTIASYAIRTELGAVSFGDATTIRAGGLTVAAGGFVVSAGTVTLPAASVADAAIAATIARRNAANTFSGLNTLQAGLTVSGGSITLPAASIADAALAATIARRTTNTFTGLQTLNAGLSVAGGTDLTGGVTLPSGDLTLVTGSLNVMAGLLTAPVCVVGDFTATGIFDAGTITAAALELAAGGTIAYFGVAGQAQKTVTGSRGGNAALASLLAQLAAYGLVVNSTTA